MIFNNAKKAFIIFAFILLITHASFKKTGSKCHTNDDCPDLHSCQHNVCKHKPLFPITVREVFGTIIVLLLNALLTAGGVGAGAAYVPYISLLFGVTLQQSVYIGYACVFGGGLGNLMNTIRLKNPETGRYLINFNINMIVLPALMIGVMIGLIINRVIAPVMVNIILLLVLVYSSTKNLSKLKLNLKKEKNDKIAKAKNNSNARNVAESDIGPTQNGSQIIDEGNQEGFSKNYIKEQENSINPLRNMSYRSNVLTTNNEQKSNNMLTTVLKNNFERNTTVNLETNAKEDDVIEKSEFLSKIDSESDNKIKDSQPEPSILRTGNNDGSESQSIKSENRIQANNTVPVIVINQAQNNSVKDPMMIKREQLYLKEKEFPFYKLRQLSYIIIIIVVIGLIRGTSHFKPVVGIKWTCWWDFVWFTIAILIYSACLARNISLVLKWQKEKQEVKYEFRPEEPILDFYKIVKLIFVATCAGILGAIVALGGSMIVGPTLLDFKMPPAFSAATTGLFMIFSMFNTMFNTVLNGKTRNKSDSLVFTTILSVFFYFIKDRKLVHKENWKAINNPNPDYNRCSARLFVSIRPAD